MSRRTFVHDSEDDEDGMSSPGRPELREHDQDKAQRSDRPEKSSRSDTSSTELMREATRDAHDALFASNSATKRSLNSTDDHQQTIISPDAERAKRRKTMDSVERHVSPQQRSERRKTMRTYCGSGSLGNDVSTKAMDMKFETWKSDGHFPNPSSHAVPGNAEETSVSARQLHDGNSAWHLPGSVMENFANHEPTVMFPSGAELSSTVPNNTMTQQRLLNEAVVADVAFMQPQLPSEAGNVQSSTSSGMNWSDFIQSPPGKTSPAAKSTHSPQNAAASSRLHRTSATSKKPSSSSDDMPPPHGSPDRRNILPTTPMVVSPAQNITTMCSLQSTTPKTAPIERSTTPTYTPPPRSSERLRRSKTSNDMSASRGLERRSSRASGQEESHPTAEKQTLSDSKYSESNTKRKRASSIRSTEADAAKVESSALATSRPSVKNSTNDRFDQGSGAADLPMDDSKSCSGRSRSRQLNDSVEDRVNIHANPSDRTRSKAAHPSSDGLVNEATISLSKEQYKPRASRSRSTQLLSFDNIDFSKDPGRVARNKRRKTTDLSNLSKHGSKSPDDSLVKSVLDMGFSPSRAKNALKESRGNVEAALDVLVSRNHDQKTREDKQWVVSKSETPNNEKEEQDLAGRRVIAAVEISGIHLADLPGPDSNIQTFTGLGNMPVETMRDASANGKRGGLKSGLEERLEAEEHPNVSENEEPKRGRKRPTKPGLKQGSTVKSDAVESETPTQKPATIVSMPEPSKKRGRGRPKSEKLVVEEEELEFYRGDDEEQPENDQSETQKLDKNYLSTSNTAGKKEEPMKELDSNAGINEAQKNANSPVPAQDFATPEPRPPKKSQTMTPASSPVQAHQQTTPAPQRKSTPVTQHSPINKGKMPYRVGLSRNARIPSLLKVLKK